MAESTLQQTAEQGLEKVTPAAKTPEVITTPDEYRASLALWAQRQYNVLSPFSNLSGLAPQHGIMSSLIQIDPRKEAGEVYDGLPFLKAGEVALAKVGLRKLAECAGISISTHRTDDRHQMFYWEFKAIASYRGVDGSTITREATKEWDLRDGSMQMKGWTANQVEEGRKHGLRNCEARSINAAIREAGCGIKQKYTRAELAKPFVVLRVAFRADMTDPDQKRMVVERALGSTAALYPSAHGAALPSHHPDVDPEDPPTAQGPRSVGRGSTTQAAPATSTATASTAAPPSDQPPTESAVRIVDIKEKSGTTKGKAWKKWDITDSRGEMRGTFSDSVRDLAETAKKTGAWVELSTERDGEYVNIIEISPAGQQPSLLPSQSDL